MKDANQTSTAKRKALLNSRTLAYSESLKLANALLKCWLLLAAVVVSTILLVLAPATPSAIISILAGYLLVFVPTFLFLFKKRQDARDAIAAEQEQYIFKIGAYTD